jgi:hypothetical protein
MLGPVSSHAAAETRQVAASLGSQPTVAGHSGDHPPDLETLRANPQRMHQILIQGNLYPMDEHQRRVWVRQIEELDAFERGELTIGN